MKKTNVVLAIWLGTLMLIGCSGDDGEDDAPTIKPPVSGDTQASDMDEDEVIEFCESIYSVMGETMKMFVTRAETSYCSNEGFEAGFEAWEDDEDDDEIEEECESAVRDCEEDMEENNDDDDDDDDAPTPEDICEDSNRTIEDCDAEVGDIAECLNAMNQMAIDVIMGTEAPACSKLSDDYFDDLDDSDDDDDDPETPDICEDVLDECPELEEMAVSMDDMPFSK
jgi:hypothetical protein